MSTGRTHRFTKNRGFTLVELMITVAIIGILAAIAYPSYQDQMRKGRRAATQTHLMDIAQKQQQYLLDARSYSTTVASLGLTTPSDVSSYYTISIAVGAGATPSFTATATPIAGSAQAADGAMTIDNTGAKTPAGYW